MSIRGSYLGSRLRVVAAMAVTASLLLGCGTERESPADRPTTSAETDAAAAETRYKSLEPAETVIEMLEAYVDKRLGEYYHFVASTDKEVKSLDELQAEFAPTAADLITDFLFLNTSFEVDSARVEDDSALVYVTSLAPPVSFVINQANIVERDLGPDTDMKTKLSILGERHRLSGGPYESNSGVYRLILEPAGWRVVIGWAEMEAAPSGTAQQ